MGVNRMKKNVILCIVAIVSLLILIGGFFSYLCFFSNYTFLGSPVTQDAYTDLNNFIQQSVNDYYADKKVTLSFGEFVKEIPASELQTVNIEKTAEVLNSLNNENLLLKLTDNTVFPVINLNDNAIKDFIITFIKDNNIADFYSVNEDLKSVNVDLNKNVPDIQKTYYEIAKKLNYTDFSKTDLKSLDEVSVNDCQYLYEMICQPAVNAQIDYESENKDIIPEKDGFTINIEDLRDKIISGEKTFFLDIKEILKPEITSLYLENKILFGDVLATLSSRYNAGIVGRSKNVTLAAEKINGIILKPGEVFSYNKAVGPRTYENGFKDAGVYTATGLENGVGGGICQVSSTLYGAQLMADLKTVSRTNHSYAISYLPSGQDATVSYGTIDYKFMNDKTFPIKIECFASGGVLTVNILGIKDDNYYDIKLTNKIVGSSSPETIEREVDSLAEGEKNVIQTGQDGLTVETFKNYYKDGQFVKSVFVHKSVYYAMPRIVEVGKKDQTEKSDVEETEISTEGPEQTEIDAEKHEQTNSELEAENDNEENFISELPLENDNTPDE